MLHGILVLVVSCVWVFCCALGMLVILEWLLELIGRHLVCGGVEVCLRCVVLREPLLRQVFGAVFGMLVLFMFLVS